jgi:hypothetical protein
MAFIRVSVDNTEYRYVYTQIASDQKNNDQQVPGDDDSSYLCACYSTVSLRTGGIIPQAPEKDLAPNQGV